MTIFGIIPARYASTRFPAKPLAKIQDKSMIEWVYHRAAKAFEIVAVATDDERIADEVKRFGGNVVMTSPNHRSGTDRCAEALFYMQKNTGKQADVVVNIQGDEPFVDSNLLKELASCFDNQDTDIATIVKFIDNNEELFDPNCVKAVMDQSGKALYFSRSPIPYIRGSENKDWCTRHTFYKHLGLYAYRAKVLLQLTQLPPSSLEIAESLEQNRWLENGYSIHVKKTDHESISIDTPEDLTRAQLWIKNQST